VLSTDWALAYISAQRRLTVAAVGFVLGANGVSGSWGRVTVLVVDMVAACVGSASGWLIDRLLLVANKGCRWRERLSLTSQGCCSAGCVVGSARLADRLFLVVGLVDPEKAVRGAIGCP
jgi:hypothetical protein